MEWIRQDCGFGISAGWAAHPLLLRRWIRRTTQGGSLLLCVLLVLIFFVFGFFRSERGRARGLFLLILRGDFAGATGQVGLRKLQAVGSGIDRVLQHVVIASNIRGVRLLDLL